jgi:hypothetical protein
MPQRRTTTESKRRAGSYRPGTARDLPTFAPGRPRAPK